MVVRKRLRGFHMFPPLVIAVSGRIIACCSDFFKDPVPSSQAFHLTARHVAFRRSLGILGENLENESMIVCIGRWMTWDDVG